MKKIIPFSLLIFIFDQIIKLFIGYSITLNSSIIVIKDFFSISNVHNYGAAFSILTGNRLLLILISFFALSFLYYYLLRGKTFRIVEMFIYSLLIGGILGNLFDRIFYGYVVDYLDFNILGYNFPVFNLADICIVISVILMFIDIVWSGRNASNSR